MLERIDPKLLRAGDALSVGGGADRQPRQPPHRRGVPDIAAGEEQSGERIDEALARLAAVIADVERLGHDDGGAADALYPPNAHDVATWIVRDGAAALAAQASLGPAGVRLVLDAGEDAAEAPK